MAEQTPEDKLEKAQEALEHCKKERAAAKNVLKASEDFSRSITSIVNGLKKERGLRHKREDNRITLEKLKERIEEEENARPRAQKRLEEVQKALEELRAEESRLGGEQGKNRTEIRNLKGQIRKKQKEESRAEENVRQRETTLAKLQSEESQLRVEQNENVTELENLKRQTQEEQEREAQARTSLNRKWDALRDLEKQAPASLKRDKNGTELEDPKSQNQDTGQKVNEDSVEKQATLTEMWAEESRLRSEADKDETELKDLEGRIRKKLEEAIQEKQKEKKNAVSRANKVLKKKKWAVTKVAVAFNCKAIGVLLKTFKEPILDLVKKLNVFGTTVTGYGYLTVLDNTYKSVASGNVLAGATALDLLSSLLSVSSAGTILLLLFLLLILYGLVAGLVILPIHRWTEFWARRLQRLVQNTPVKTLLSLLVLVFPLGGVAGVSYSNPEGLGLPKDRVCIQRIDLSEDDGQQATPSKPPENCQKPPPLYQQATSPYLKTEEFILLNSNSTYMFVRKEGDGDKPGEEVPLSDVVRKNVNDGAWEWGPAALQYAMLKIAERLDTLDGKHETLNQEHQAIINLMPPNGPHAHPEFEALSGRMGIIDEEHGALRRDHRTMLTRMGEVEKANNDLRQDHEALRQEHAGYAAKNHNHKNDDPRGHEHATYAAKDHAHPSYASANHKHKSNGPGESHEHANYITEDLLRTRINKEMACDGGEDTRISGFIRFNKGSANLGDFATNSKEIENFASKRGQATKWMVFGFASPDGEQERNNALAYKRAVVVKNLLCDKLKPDCANGTKIEMKGFSEDHPINGIANSRSAIIAICTKREASQVE